MPRGMPIATSSATRLKEEPVNGTGKWIGGGVLTILGLIGLGISAHSDDAPFALFGLLILGSGYQRMQRASLDSADESLPADASSSGDTSPPAEPPQPSS